MNNNKQIFFEFDMTKSELKDFVKDTISIELKNKAKDNEIVNEKKVRDIIKDMLKKHYKTLWNKSMYFTDDL